MTAGCETADHPGTSSRRTRLFTFQGANSRCHLKWVGHRLVEIDVSARRRILLIPPLLSTRWEGKVGENRTSGRGAPAAAPPASRLVGDGDARADEPSGPLAADRTGGAGERGAGRQDVVHEHQVQRLEIDPSGG